MGDTVRETPSWHGGISQGSSGIWKGQRLLNNIASIQQPTVPYLPESRDQ